MSKIVMTLITHSFGNQNYRKVIECLQVMRKTAAEVRNRKEGRKKYRLVMYGRVSLRKRKAKSLMHSCTN